MAERWDQDQALYAEMFGVAKQLDQPCPGCAVRLGFDGRWSAPCPVHLRNGCHHHREELFRVRPDPEVIESYDGQALMIPIPEYGMQVHPAAGYGEPTPGRVELRCGDVDRAAAVSALAEHLTAGRLSLDEYEERVVQAYAARHYAEFTPLFRDLPAPTGPTGPVNPFSSAGGELKRRPRPRRPLVRLVVQAVAIALISVGLFLGTGAVAFLVAAASLTALMVHHCLTSY